MTAEVAQRAGAEFVSKEQLFERSDILTIHLVLSDRSRGMVGASLLNSMKPTARLVNTSRGPLVDEGALIDVLERRRIAGAALDVFDQEPLPKDHPFRTLPESHCDAARRLRCTRIVQDVLRRHCEEHREVVGCHPKLRRRMDVKSSPRRRPTIFRPRRNKPGS